MNLNTHYLRTTDKVQLEGMFFKMKQNNRIIGKEITFTSKSEIESSNLKYTDDFGHEIEVHAKNITKINGIVTIEFDYFYMKDYEFEINGYNLYENGIEDISIVEINQWEFKESDDTPHGHLLDNFKMSIQSNLSHEGNNILQNVLNDDQHKIFKSVPYNYGEYGEVIIKTNTICLIDEFYLLSSIYNTQVLNDYTISYKTNDYEDWKEIVRIKNNNQQSTRNIFKPILATQFSIKVTRSSENKIFLGNISIIKYSTLRTEINNLFTSPSLSRLNKEVNQETIVSLKERVIYTEDYMRLLDRASDLFIDREFLNPKILKLDLEEVTLINHIAFTNNRNILKGVIKYKDIIGNTCLRRLHWYPENIVNGVIKIGVEHPVIGKMRVMSNDVEILIYGSNNVEFIEYQSLPLNDAFLTEEQAKLDINKCFSDGTYIAPLMVMYKDTPIHGWCPPCKPGGPLRPIIDPIENNLLRLGDNNINQYFRTLDFKASGFADIRIFLEKEMFIGQVDVMSFFPNGNGHVEEFEILAEDISASKLSWDENAHERNWVTLGFAKRNETTDEYITTKLKPYYTDKIIIRIIKAKDYKANINEIRVYEYSTLDTEVDNLFIDNTYTQLKKEVNLDIVNNIKARTLINGRFTEKLELAKELLTSNVVPDNNKFVQIDIPIDEVKVFNKLQLTIEEEIPTSIEIIYIDGLGIKRKKACEYSLKTFRNKSYIMMNLPNLCVTKLQFIVNGVSSIQNLTVNDIYIEAFLETFNHGSKLNLSGANLSVPIIGSQNLNNLRDSSLSTYCTTDYFTEQGYCDLKISFRDSFLLESVNLLSFRSTGASGMIKEYKVLGIDPLTEELTELGTSKNITSTEHKKVVLEIPYFTNEIILRITNAVNNWALINDVELHTIIR
ncbi:MAG: hypothetical protein ACRDDH_03080 [Cetobacterium sp.]|uniref:hypothetical protein n=1 Tax=Cetobacterium sp. TaxID=2071632 RepID=UPI003EE44558